MFGKRKMKAEIIGGEDLPQDLKEKIADLGEEIVKTLEAKRGDSKESDAKLEEEMKKPQKVLMEWDGKGELKVEVSVHHKMLRTMLLHLVQNNPEMLPVFVDVLEYVQHTLNCDCENCEEFKQGMAKSFKEDLLSKLKK